MSEVSTGDDKPKKGKPKKIATRVDFTPMVDMNMLLITFFMFCTSLAKPKTMEIAMPSNDKDITDEDKNKVKDTNAITLLLGENDKIYYYLGKAKATDMSTLKLANYNGVDDKSSLRYLLLDRNRVRIAQILELKKLKYQKKISEDDFKANVSKIKNAKNGLTVVIKPTDDSNYKNLIDVLDEMQICSIGIYAIVPLEPVDKIYMSNKKSGALTQASVSK